MERLTAEQVEEDWKRALDSASEAVTFCAEAKLLTPAYAAREVAIIGAERKWLERARPTLRRLFPPPPRSAMMSRHQRPVSPPRAAHRPAHWRHVGR